MIESDHIDDQQRQNKLMRGTRWKKMMARGISNMPLIYGAFLLVLLLDSGDASSVNDCRGVKYAYSAKGLDQNDVPRQPRQGKQQNASFSIPYVYRVSHISSKTSLIFENCLPRRLAVIF